MTGTDAADAPQVTDATDATVDASAPPSIIGVVRRYESVDKAPFARGADLNVWNIAIPPAAGSTTVTSPTAVSAVDGTFRLDDIPQGAAAELELRPNSDLLPNDAGVASGVRTHVSMRVPTNLPLQNDVPLVSFTWLAQVAVDCGVGGFTTLDQALYDMNGFTNGYFISRSVVLGELQATDGGPYLGSSIAPSDITVDVGDDEPFHNNVNNAEDTDNLPAVQVCFLDTNASTHQYVGSKATASVHGANRFVMFRVRNLTPGIGKGNAVVHVKGFAPASVYLLASGSIGVVSLRVGADPSPPTIPPTRTFHDDVYPLFGNLGCLSGCHVPPNGTGYVATGSHGIGGLDLSTESAALASLRLGETAACATDATVLTRLCPADPPRSLLLTVPLTQPTNSNHPYPVFDSTNDPNYLIVKQWIAQQPKP